MLLYTVKIFQGKLAVVELAVNKYALHHVLHEGLYPLGGGLFQRPRSCFNGIRQHYDAGLLRLGARPRIPEILLANRVEFRVLDFLGPVIEVSDKTCPVMLLYHLNDLAPELILFRQLHPLLHVRKDNEGTHVG